VTEILTKIKRRYFEVFGDLEKEINFLRKTNLLLSFIILLMLGSVIYLGAKPPVVIRVSRVEGAKTIQDLHTNNLPEGYEMVGFAKRFTISYTAFNSYTYTRDFAEAFNLMTARFQKEARKAMDPALIDKLKDVGINTEIQFKEAKLERDSDEAGIVSLVGVRHVTKYAENVPPQEILFRADLVLKKVRRTLTTPEGLLVEAYHEITLNDVTRKDSTSHD